MLGALSKSFMSHGSKLQNLRCLGSILYNYHPNIGMHNDNRLSIPGKEVSKKIRNLQTLDGVPLNYDIIYNSHDYHAVAQHGCTALSGGFMVVGVIQMIRNFEEMFPDLWSTALNLWFTTLYFYVNIGTAFITYRSPVRIYFDKETGVYRAIFNHWIPTKIRILEFRKGEVEHLPPGDELSLFRFSRYKIKEQKLYMLESFFRYPGDLYNMFDELETEGEHEDNTAK